MKNKFNQGERVTIEFKSHDGSTEKFKGLIVGVDNKGVLNFIEMKRVTDYGRHFTFNPKNVRVIAKHKSSKHDVATMAIHMLNAL